MLLLSINLYSAIVVITHDDVTLAAQCYNINYNYLL